ncbi:hypothetical protein HY485_03490 [Candidatus Woesearchaeota archaeon]|nr:hypothetical protein [Candidatus Woesearchaeota archaeon]
MNTKLVDGFRIRNIIDVDFSGVGSRSMYVYIPENELWIDEVLEKEREFLKGLHFVEASYLEKLTYAETRRRICHDFLTPTEQKPDPVIYSFPIPHPHVNVCIVKGEIARKYYDPKFIQGGHDLVYSYISHGNIWVEKAFEKDQDFIILHEAFERNLMLTGMSYDNAHEFACAVEKNERRRQGVGKYLKG